MLAEIATGLSSLKTAGDILKAFNGVKTDIATQKIQLDLQRAMGDAQAGLLAAQDAQAALTGKISKLEDEIARLKNWDADKQRYELKRYYPGSLTYTVKPGMDGGEPTHHLCANCYQGSKKSILQATTEIQMRYRIHVCHSCNGKVPLGAEMPST